jgi:tetratricopeptide (TPR) repeat protein
MKSFNIIIISIILVIFAGSLIADTQDLTSEGNKNFRSAKMHLNGGRFEKALPLYLLVIEENPNHIESLENIAGIYYDYKGDYFEASKYYSQTIAAIDNEINALEQEKIENPKKEKKNNKKIDKFLESRERLEKLNSSCWIKLFRIAQNKFSNSSAFFSLQPDTLDTTDPEVLAQLNSVLSKAFMDTIKIADIENNPVNLEEIHAKFDQLLDESIQDFQKLDEFAPDSTKTLKMLAYAYSIQGDEEKTLEYFIKVAELDKNDEIVRQKIANTYFERENHEEALKWFQAAASINPENQDNYYNMAIVYIQLEDTLNTYESFKKVVKYNPQNLDAILNASNYAATLGNIDESIKYLEMAIEIEPDNIDFISFLCYKLYQEERFTETVKYAQMWYDLDNKSSDAAQMIYHSAKKIGNTELEKKFEDILKNM